MTIQQHVSGLLNNIQLATDQTFLVIHLLLSAVPILLFLCFATSITLFTLSFAAIISLFWVTGALVVLISFLLVSGFIGTSIWISGVGGLIALKWGHKTLLGRKQLEITIRDSGGTQINEKQIKERE